MMGIQDPRAKIDFDLSIMFTAVTIEKDGIPETPEQEHDRLVSQFAALQNGIANAK